MTDVKIGIIGLGTVGGGVYDLLIKKTDEIISRVNSRITVKKVCDKRMELKEELNIPDSIFTTDIQEIINDDEISLVVVLTGIPDLAFEIIKECFKNSKHVVTANKALLARNWAELFSLARKNKRLLYFEASVGSGIPVIQGVNEGLAANSVYEIKGILNGTTNYVMTEMSKASNSFKEALEMSVMAGFAEPDSSADISGLDAAHKICVLANVVNKYPVDFKDVYYEGIDELDLQDIVYGRDLFNCTIKLIAVMKKHNDKIEIRVHPAFISFDHMLASVNYENNGILVKGDAVGQVMFYGRGAGRYPAASAVVSDVIYLAQKINYGIAGDIPYIHTSTEERTEVIDMKDLKFKYYIRFTTVDKPGVLSTIAGILGKNNVSITSCFQEGPKDGDNTDVPILMLTHKAREGSLINALDEINRLDIIRKQSVFIRMEA